MEEHFAGDALPPDPGTRTVIVLLLRNSKASPCLCGGSSYVKGIGLFVSEPGEGLFLSELPL